MQFVLLIPFSRLTFTYQVLHPRRPRGTSRDDAIFLGESLLQELKSPWELILIEPVSEVLEFRSADWAEKYFSAQSAMRSSRVTLSPSYTKQFSSSINFVAWPVQREDCPNIVDLSYRGQTAKLHFGLSR